MTAKNRQAEEGATKRANDSGNRRPEAASLSAKELEQVSISRISLPLQGRKRLGVCCMRNLAQFVWPFGGMPARLQVYCMYCLTIGY